jgi:gamma-glutamyl hydrolase
MPSTRPRTAAHLCLAAAAVAAAAAATPGLTTRPTVGIYAAPFVNSTAGGGGCPSSLGCDYVAASYVKWLESAGAESVPIPYNSTDDQVDHLFPQLNGVLFPGGGATLPPGAKRVFDLALAANDNGTHFPVWGTCLGFEWLVELVSGDYKILEEGFDSENVSLPLSLTGAASSSRLYGPTVSVPGHRDRSEAAAAQWRSDLGDASNPVAMNNHQAGISPSKFAADAKLPTFFTVLSTNQDRGGRSFVSTLEGKAYPVYGTQWHPEKNNFEFGLAPDGQPYEAINHSPEAVFASQELANYLVGEARRNDHRRDPTDPASRLFWDYTVSEAKAPEFQQVYFVPR